MDEKRWEEELWLNGIPAGWRGGSFSTWRGKMGLTRGVKKQKKKKQSEEKPVGLEGVNPKLKLFVGLLSATFLYEMMRRDVESFDWVEMGVLAGIAGLVCWLIPKRAFSKRRKGSTSGKK